MIQSAPYRAGQGPREVHRYHCSHCPHRDWLPVLRYWCSDPDLNQLSLLLHEYGLRIGTPMVQVLQAALEQMSQINAAITERPFSLVHGDLRADNLMFDGPSDAPSVSLLDWQTVTRSLPAIDLAYLFGGSEPEIERAGHVDELLSLWHGERRHRHQPRPRAAGRHLPFRLPLRR